MKTINKIIGRESEIQELNKIYQSKRAEFVAIVGRRRVGKTFLIRKYFHNENGFFEISGEKEASKKEQLSNFSKQFALKFMNLSELIKIQEPKNWKQAFELLTTMVDDKFKNKKFIFFIDELPWLCGQKSGALQAIDYYWNNVWSKKTNFKLIVCGSAASWMLENLILSKAGLHNRLTKTLYVESFNVIKTADFFKAKGFRISNKQVMELSMIMGGIPFYLDQLDRSDSVIKNIEKMCFSKNGLLTKEFNIIFQSLFDNYEIHENIVRFLSQKNIGYTRNEILNKLKITSGGTFNKRIKELEAAGFVTSYAPVGRLKKDTYYRLSDEYCFFYLRFIEPVLSAIKKDVLKSYWSHKVNSQEWISWSGFAFERLVQKNIKLILKDLGGQGLIKSFGPWIGNYNKEKAQIDLLIERSDRVFQIVEIKFSNDPFIINKDYALSLTKKIDIIKNTIGKNHEIKLCFITPFGLQKNSWSLDLVDTEIKFSDYL